AVPHERKDLEEDLCAYDGVIGLEEPELDLARALGPLTSLRERRQARLRIRIPALVFAAEEAPLHGITVDLSSAGAGLHLPGRPCGDFYQIIFHRSDNRSVAVGARTAWIDGWPSN